MTAVAGKDKPYDRLLSGARHRASRVKGRTLEEEADADRGRVLFSAPFRRLQNKAQVFSLESNAAVRSRLTHSLEVASIGRFVAQQAIKAFSHSELETLGIAGKERPLTTFVETACLLHDLGNPPFGHFGEIAISDWFHLKADSVKVANIATDKLRKWDRYYLDFQHFDGNPQGFRIGTKLQPSETGDLCGLNLTATTLAATLKYPWKSDSVGEKLPGRNGVRKKAGYFHTEQETVDWICATLMIRQGSRHPLVNLMEAADDIAYCVSDIEDGIEKGLIRGPQFAEYMERHAGAALSAAVKGKVNKDARDILRALDLLKEPRRAINGGSVERLTPMQDFHSAVIRFLARSAGVTFRIRQESILEGTEDGLLRDSEASPLLAALKEFAESSLYSSPVVRSREITAQAVLGGLLDAYLPLMCCDRGRFNEALAGHRRDDHGRPIARDSSLMSRISRKYLAVYREALRRTEDEFKGDSGAAEVMERIHRMRLIVDHVSGMTDEFALRSFQLISGVHVNPNWV
jgi:dGTPase